MHSALTLHNLSVCINGKQRELSVPHQAGRPAGVHQYRQQAFKNISENIFENRFETSLPYFGVKLSCELQWPKGNL